MDKHLLSDIALFIEVVNTGSFTLAAQRLEMPPSTLSRRVSALEKAIGFRLLNRSTRKVEVTAEGQAYFQRCKPLLEEAKLAHEDISHTIHVPSGVLRLACTPDFASLYLADVLLAYHQENPGVRVELVLNSQVEDLIGHQLDLALRMGPVRESALVARPLGSLPQGIYASPRFLQSQTQAIRTPQDLAGVACIRLSASSAASTWSIRARSGEPPDRQTVAVRGSFTTGGPSVACQLALAHAGLALLDEKLAKPHVQAGTLQRVLPDWQPTEVPVHALSTSRLVPARVRRFVHHLKLGVWGQA